MENNCMSDNKTNQATLSDRALEMVMRDVIDSMSEYSLESGFQPYDGGFEIIDIYPVRQKVRPNKQHQAAVEDSEVIEFPNLRRAAG
jgi:hypothetical protein